MLCRRGAGDRGFDEANPIDRDRAAKRGNMSTGYRIVKKEVYSPVTYMWEVEAPDVARMAQPGHFVMVRMNERGERIPLTVADFDRQRGTVTVVVQAVGKSTQEMMRLDEGDSILDFIGPLGEASHIRRRSKVILVGGGLGVAPKIGRAHV